MGVKELRPEIHPSLSLQGRPLSRSNLKDQKQIYRRVRRVALVKIQARRISSSFKRSGFQHQVSIQAKEISDSSFESLQSPSGSFLLYFKPCKKL